MREGLLLHLRKLYAILYIFGAKYDTECIEKNEKEKLAKNSVFGQYADIARGAVAGVLALCQY